MSLSAHRKQKSAASTTPKTKAPKSKSPSKASAVVGPMRTIGLAKAYREFTAQLDGEGAPAPRSYFDPKGRASVAVKDRDEPVNKKRVLNSPVLLDHLNETVFKQIFGVPLRREIIRMILDGIGYEVLELAEKGYKVKVPSLVTVNREERKARMAHNPRTGDPVHVQARSVLVAKPTRSARAYMDQAD